MDYKKDIQKALSYIEKNLHEKLSLKEISKIACMSDYHFKRVFKKEVKMGVYQYIQQRRISEASFLLLNSDLSIIDISLVSGYSSQEAFSRVFKEYYNLPPRQYKNKFKNFFRENIIMANQEIKGWIISGSNIDEYNIMLDNSTFHSGNQSVKISGSKNLNSENFTTVMQQISAKNYLNKRVKLSAYLKSENIDGWGGIWFRVDGKNFEQLKFDNMQDRPVVGTNSWNYYSSVLDVPIEADILNFGFLLQGSGNLWADDFNLEVVTKDVKTTDFSSEQIYPDKPSNLSFTQ